MVKMKLMLFVVKLGQVDDGRSALCRQIIGNAELAWVVVIPHVMPSMRLWSGQPVEPFQTMWDYA